MKMSPFQFLRSLLSLLIIPAASFMICLGIMFDLYWIRRSKRKAKSLLRAWARFLCRAAWVKVRVEGQSNLDASQTYIFVANHTSQVDIWSFQGYSPHDFSWIAKKELFKIPILGRTMRAVDFIALNRASGRQAVKDLNTTAANIADGNSVLIFPEGTRSKNGHLQSFKTGASILAIKAGVPVVPVGFNGTHQILPKGSLLSRGGEVVIRIGSPVPTDKFRLQDRQQLTRHLQQQVADLLDPDHQPLSEEPIKAKT